ncbi:MAG: ABC transporter permease [Solirubrobacteraceae bacterium]
MLVRPLTARARKLLSTLAGVCGPLAGRQMLGNPRRVAGTAGTLAVAVATVMIVAALAATISSSQALNVVRLIRADYVISTPPGAGLSRALALSVLERTRELGLLRAVGAQARQIRAIVRTEALATVTIGALTGLAVGLAIGWPLARAIDVYILGPPGIPVALLIAVLPGAVLAGLLASAVPARRAACLGILTALHTE